MCQTPGDRKSSDGNNYFINFVHYDDLGEVWSSLRTGVKFSVNLSQECL